MVGTEHLMGFAGRVLAVLFVLSSCAAAEGITPTTPAPAVPVAGLAVVPEVVAEGPNLVDTQGMALAEVHAEVVRSVHRALTAGDLDALSRLYVGDDWAGQAVLLAGPLVRQSVLDALRTSPANLGEGYLYPGTGVPGYQTAFFLDYDPPHAGESPLRWRGIAPPASVGSAT